MPDLEFKVLGATAARYAAVPTLNLRVAIAHAAATERAPIQSIALQCQIRIDPRRRVYKPGEKERLSELFGEPGRWSRTLHSLLWTHVGMVVPGFDGAGTEIDLPVPCSFDFNVAATKYFDALEYEKVPLLLLFSGSVFYRNANRHLEMSFIAQDKEACFRLPFAVWQEMMEIYYPNQNWLTLDRRVFEALHAYKRRHGYMDFDEALMNLLPAA
jgi:hypothetical protein